MNRRGHIIFLLASVSAALSLFASPVRGKTVPGRWTPFQLSIASPAQVFSPRRDVNGIRVVLFYGRAASVRGVDVGCYNESKNLFGLQAGVLNEVVSPGDEKAPGKSRIYGMQVAVAGNFAGSGDCRASVGGFQLGMLFNSLTMESFRGLQFAGVYNMTSEGVFYGMQFSGIINSADSRFAGLQFALGGNHSEMIRGIQFAAVGNYGGELRGIQLSGLFNAVVDADAKGLQFSGLVNYSEKGVTGLQAAPVFNGIEEGAVRGAQLGLLCNEAYSGDVIGMQFGLINIAHNVHGVQVGLINLAQKMTGVQIGIFNIIIEGGLPFFPIINASVSY